MRPEPLYELDDELASRVVGHDTAAFETLMRRHNQRLFRVARAILRDDAEAEDVLQDAYLDAYRHMGEFRARCPAPHVAHAHRRQPRADAATEREAPRTVVSLHAGGEGEPGYVDVADDSEEPPSQAALRAEVRRVIERRIDDLPAGVPHRVRHARRRGHERAGDGRRARHPVCHRAHPAVPCARAAARGARAGPRHRDADVFGFAGDRCDRIVAGVLSRCSDLRTD